MKNPNNFMTSSAHGPSSLGNQERGLPTPTAYSHLILKTSHQRLEFTSLTYRFCTFVFGSSPSMAACYWAGQQQQYGPPASGIHMKTYDKTLRQT